ncbi:MAG: hypothetical protein WA838_07765 [Xanthobacteraceae bacterium]|jgi:hypothetical protein
MNLARVDVCRKNVVGRDAAPQKWLRTLLGVVLAAGFALPGASALAQDNPIMPKLSIGGEEKRKLTPEELERQKQIDADYKAATSKIPAQKAPDPWADVRQAPTASGQKSSASTQSASAQKKKQSAQQPQ